MARALRWFGLGAAALVLAGCLVALAARFSDGPLGPFPGGPLVAGELVREPAPERLRRLGAEVARKYGVGDAESAVAGRDVWFFRMDPRPAA